MGSKKKKIKQGGQPPKREIRDGGNPESVYKMHPTWNFHICDKEGKWAFTSENRGEDIWKKIIPFLSNLETQTWNEILIGAKKKNHTIKIENLNKCARKRLNSLHLTPDEVISLSLDGNIRIYGVWYLSTCCLLWYDKDHKDNDDCVCRSRKKHT